MSEYIAEVQDITGSREMQNQKQRKCMYVDSCNIWYSKDVDPHGRILPVSTTWYYVTFSASLVLPLILPNATRVTYAIWLWA